MVDLLYINNKREQYQKDQMYYMNSDDPTEEEINKKTDDIYGCLHDKRKVLIFAKNPKKILGTGYL